jgi:sterol desaturase/sphingolipid hydroxylase (fatty acid hydroxylase superfamily)
MNITRTGLLALGLAGVFALLLGTERVFPLRLRTRPAPDRIFINLVFSALVFATGVVAIRPMSMALMAWSSTRSSGLLRFFALPNYLQAVLGFGLMDLSFYYWHRINHEWRLLWRFHSVHHVDPDLDVTTSFRFHAVEILYSAAFRAVQVLLLGISPLTYITYEVVFQLSTMFHHSNLQIPISLERRLNWILVTPRMHGIHHSIVRRETNSNYSVIFRWWDQLHRSLILNVAQVRITIGVAGYLEPRDNSFWHLLAQPFRLPRWYSKKTEDLWRGTEQVSRSTFMAE